MAGSSGDAPCCGIFCTRCMTAEVRADHFGQGAMLLAKMREGAIMLRIRGESLCEGCALVWEAVELRARNAAWRAFLGRSEAGT